MEIKNLKDKKEFLLPLAQWHQAEWAYLNPGQTLQMRLDKMQAYFNDDFIPTTYVAFKQQAGKAVLLGSAAIVKNDMPEQNNYTPWLASVYVDKTHRKEGIASTLIGHVLKMAKENALQKIYLYTPGQQSFYQKRGWQLIEKQIYHATEVSVMMYDLTLGSK